ncbi:hypothetical protein DBB33_14465 [Chromobacterium haemolyticum]|nr:hypothetical protein DBB33_14465 [Chromobacterium haemolyticum]
MTAKETAMRQTAQAGQTIDGHYSFIPARSYRERGRLASAQTDGRRSVGAVEILRQIKFK